MASVVVVVAADELIDNLQQLDSAVQQHPSLNKHPLGKVLAAYAAERYAVQPRR